MGDLNQDGAMSLLSLIVQRFMVDFFMENDAWMAKPELALKMPACRSFAMLRDYNQDGVADITHTTGGIAYIVG